MCERGREWDGSSGEREREGEEGGGKRGGKTKRRRKRRYFQYACVKDVLMRDKQNKTKKKEGLVATL